VAFPEGLAEALGDLYAIERELGRGGMATVYLARDLKHDRLVALKLLHEEVGAAVGPDRFLREIRMAARLQHPHILSVHDSGESAGRRWYTMPFVEGESLRDRLRRERQLPVSDAVRIAREVADALGYAHAHGVVHRDIKPENILLSGYPTGDRGAGEWHALVADFGVAKAVAPDGGDGVTQTGVVIGTPAYMSPEQSLGDSVLDGRSDLYSLGCVLYEMLAGEAPYSGTSAQAIVAKRLLEPIPHVSTVRDSVPPSVERALERLLARTAADRYHDASAFIADLDAASLPERREASIVPGGASPARRWIPAAGIAVVVLAIAGGHLLQRRPSSTAGPQPANQPIRLAVVPFDNEGAPADEYFADGLSDEVRGKLSNLPSLRVIARSSSTEYKGGRKSPREIGRELGVRYLLAGTVRWAKQGGDARVRVSPELILTDEASTVWQAPFDAPLTDVFAVQTQIAEQVAQALKLVLGTGDKAVLAERPTENLAAYDEFLRGEEISGGMSRVDVTTLKEATAHYQRAVELDSSFVAAWLQLTRAHVNAFAAGYDPSPERKAAARRAFERVAALRPGGVEAHKAASMYYTAVQGDVNRGRQENLAALRFAPGDPDLLSHQAFYETNAGQWDSALVHLRRAVELDPRSVNTLSGEAGVLMALRRYPAATDAASRTLALDSSNLESWKALAGAHASEGNIDAARATTRAAVARLGSSAVAAYFSTYALAWLLDSAQQSEVLRLRPHAYGDDTTSWGSALWSTLLLRGDTARARAYNDSARVVQERLVAGDTANYDQRQHLARMLAAAGLRDRSLREAARAMAEAEATGDSMMIGYIHERVAKILLLNGRKGEALGHLSAALAAPAGLTRAWVRLDPEFSPLLGDPRLEQLLAGP
jgi:serine/threonine-protein kinase